MVHILVFSPRVQCVMDTVPMRPSASRSRAAAVFYGINVLLFPITLIGYAIWPSPNIDTVGEVGSGLFRSSSCRE
jgi:hypothetical protein